MVPARTLKFLAITGLGALLVCMGTACSRNEPAPAPAPSPDSASLATFGADQQRWRDTRRAELLAPDGWLALVGLHWIEPGPHYVGHARDNGIRLEVGPAQLGMVALRDSHLRFVVHPGTAVDIDGKPAPKEAPLRADDDPLGASKLSFDEGRGVATVIHRGDRYALRVKHADAPTRVGFKGLTYWPGGPDWVVDARAEPHPAGTTLPIANVIGMVEATPNPYALVFERDGHSYRIEALKEEGSEGLFLVFADRTSGHGSYGAGRFLDTPAPDARGHVRVDFNQSYNPPCAFTGFATCPLPPLSNRLALAIPAGEKIYASQH